MKCRGWVWVAALLSVAAGFGSAIFFILSKPESTELPAEGASPILGRSCCMLRRRE